MSNTRPGSLLTRISVLLSLLALGIFAALSLSSNAATRFYQWPWFFYWQLLLVAPIAILGARLLAGQQRARFGPCLDAGLVLLAAANVAAAGLSPFRPQSLNAALIPVAGVSLAYLILDWIEQEAARRAGRIALVGRLMGALMALFVAVSLMRWWFTLVLPAWQAGGVFRAALSIRNTEPLGHSVYTAGFAILAAPWLAGLGLVTRGWRRGLWLTAAVLALALIPTTASRGGALAAIALLLGAAAFWLRQSALTRNQRFLVVCGVLLAAGIFTGLDPRLRHLLHRGHWSAIASESNEQREAMIEAGWLMGRARPWCGYGPGTTPLVYPHYRAQLPGGAENVLQLHNTPIQFWANLGLPGMLAALWLCFGGLGPARRSWARPADPASDPGDWYQAQAIAISFLGYAVMSLFDYQLSVPLFVATIAVLLVLWRASAAADRSGMAADFSVRASTMRLAGGLLLAALGLMLWPTLRSVRARQLFAAAADAREAGNHAAFVASAERAAAMAPWETFFLTQLAAFYGERYLQGGTPAAQTNARERCIAAMRRALTVNADLEYCHFNLGWLLLSDDPAAAEKHFRAAARLAPYRGGLYLGLGLSLLAQNEQRAATEAIALEWLNDPQAMSSPLWDAPPLSALQDKIGIALQRVSRRWLRPASLPAETQDQLRYVAALADWWTGVSTDTTGLVRHGTAEARQFFQSLPAMEQRTYVPSDSSALRPWERLYAAWRDGNVAPALGKTSPEFAAALDRLIRQHASFAGLLTAPVQGESALVRLMRNERLGYSVLRRNQDGFPVIDLYIYPENELVAKYASFLFPPKGYLPDRLLLQNLESFGPPPPR